MAKKKTVPARRIPRAAEPRMFGDGKPSVVSTQRTGDATPAASRTPAAPARSATPARPGNAARVSLPARPPVTTTQNYAYVMKDLRRLGILSAGVFAVLVVLGVVIR
jgi:hypothetical protein